MPLSNALVFYNIGTKCNIQLRQEIMGACQVLESKVRYWDLSVSLSTTNRATKFATFIERVQISQH